MCKDPIAVARFKKLFEQFQFVRFIETGTGPGRTSLFASEFCPVETVELNADTQRSALELWEREGFTWKQSCEDRKTLTHPTRQFIRSWLGDSRATLVRLIPIMPPSCLCFLLDAHGGADWPILGELAAIAEQDKPNVVIIIHDFKVPGRKWGFDSYAGQDLDLDYVKPSLDKINPHFTITFSEDVTDRNPGILYATPEPER